MLDQEAQYYHAICERVLFRLSSSRIGEARETENGGGRYMAAEFDARMFWAE